MRSACFRLAVGCWAFKVKLGRSGLGLGLKLGLGSTLMN